MTEIAEQGGIQLSDSKGHQVLLGKIQPAATRSDLCQQVLDPANSNGISLPSRSAK